VTSAILLPNCCQIGCQSHFQRDNAIECCYNYLINCEVTTGMKTPDTETLSAQRQDKQLQGITLESVMEKRRLDQALNAKEFAVCAGISYSTARSWFHLSGFPVFHGVIFWQDFVQWRTNQNGHANQPEDLPHHNGVAVVPASVLPPRAAQILRDA
jgi:hypothetical protein